MKLHTKYQRPEPSGFRKEDFLSFQLKNLFLAPVSLMCNGPEPFEKNFERGPIKAYSCEVWSKSNQLFRRRCRLKKLFTDGHRHDGQNAITGELTKPRCLYRYITPLAKADMPKNLSKCPHLCLFHKEKTSAY